MARRRTLSDEEIGLWLSVAATVARRPGATLPAKPEPPPPPTPLAAVPVPTASPYSPGPQRTASGMAPLERKLKRKLGRVGADVAIDLHGFRQDEAHRALLAFLRGAQREGARVALVVTGKGSRGRDPFDISGGAVGVLKRSVPFWLASSEFRALVSGFEDAAPVHGGTGALYVRLRRS